MGKIKKLQTFKTFFIGHVVTENHNFITEYFWNLKLSLTFFEVFLKSCF